MNLHLFKFNNFTGRQSLLLQPRHFLVRGISPTALPAFFLITPRQFYQREIVRLPLQAGGNLEATVPFHRRKDSKTTKHKTSDPHTRAKFRQKIPERKDAEIFIPSSQAET
jgi:hypothetical protein